MTTQREPDTSAEGLRRALKAARDAIAKAPDDTWGSDTMGDADVPGGLMSWPVKDEILHNIDATLADAAGQAAPVPPPVEDETRALLWSLNELAEAFESGGPVLRKTDSRKVRNAMTFIRAKHDRAEGLAKEVERLQGEVYVPGQWRCPKCNFRLVQVTLRASDGAVGFRDEPGEKCPNDGSPLWRVTEREAGNDELRAAATFIRRLSAAHAEAVTRAEEAEAREAKLREAAFPDALTPELAEVLGMPNFQCSPIAWAFVKAGEAKIAAKAETEQAFVLHWLTTLVLKHGKDWRTVAADKLDALAKAGRALASSSPTKEKSDG